MTTELGSARIQHCNSGVDISITEWSNGQVVPPWLNVQIDSFSYETYSASFNFFVEETSINDLRKIGELFLTAAARMEKAYKKEQCDKCLP